MAKDNQNTMFISQNQDKKVKILFTMKMQMFFKPDEL